MNKKRGENKSILTELVNIVRKLKEEGFTEKQIEEGLLKRGWAKDQVLEVLKRSGLKEISTIERKIHHKHHLRKKVKLKKHKKEKIIKKKKKTSTSKRHKIRKIKKKRIIKKLKIKKKKITEKLRVKRIRVTKKIKHKKKKVAKKLKSKKIKHKKAKVYKRLRPKKIIIPFEIKEEVISEPLPREPSWQPKQLETKPKEVKTSFFGSNKFLPKLKSFFKLKSKTQKLEELGKPKIIPQKIEKPKRLPEKTKKQEELEKPKKLEEPEKPSFTLEKYKKFKQIAEKPESVTETDFDRLVDFVNEAGAIKLSEIAKIFNIDIKKAEDWGKILESHEILHLHYPAIGVPELRKWKK